MHRMVNQLPSDQSEPPRPIGVGFVVATFCEHLAERASAQITDVDADARMVAALELDWSGDEPLTVADLGEVRALRQTRHEHTGQLSHCYVEWVLPRSHEVVGTLLFELGQHYGERLNELDAPTGFIMTVEAKELCDALDDTVRKAGASLDQDVSWASELLAEGVDSVRDW